LSSDILTADVKTQNRLKDIYEGFFTKI